MANESKMFHFPATIRLEGVAKALEDFLSSVKNMEVQGARTADGYVIQGRQTKDGWKTIAGMRMATTIQLTQIDSNLNVVVGQGEWSDKIGAGAVGLFIAWPLAVTGGLALTGKKSFRKRFLRRWSGIFWQTAAKQAGRRRRRRRKSSRLFALLAGMPASPVRNFAIIAGQSWKTDARTAAAWYSPAADFARNAAIRSDENSKSRGQKRLLFFV